MNKEFEVRRHRCFWKHGEQFFGNNRAGVYVDPANLGMPEIVNGTLCLRSRSGQALANIKSNGTLGVLNAFGSIIAAINTHASEHPHAVRTLRGLPGGSPSAPDEKGFD
jgi:hypothetical protein